MHAALRRRADTGVGPHQAVSHQGKGLVLLTWLRHQLERPHRCGASRGCGCHPGGAEGFWHLAPHDVPRRAEERTIAFGIGIGAGYLFKTTFEREATSDLTGERGSLMGAIEGLLEAQYEVLREHGHSPSEAFNETVEELTQSLGPLFGQKGMDWMYANCSTTAQRGALDWAARFKEAIKPVMEWLYLSVLTGKEAQISIDANSKADYRAGLEKELEAMRNKEMWRAGEVVRQLRPENN